MAGLMQLRAVKEFADAMELDIALVTQKITIDIHADIVRGTPVDTGHARANWQIGIGSWPTTTLAAKDKQPLGSDPAIKPDVATIDGEKVIYVTNALPYIGVLEDGSSKQAPVGFVGLAVARMQGEIDARIASYLN